MLQENFTAVAGPGNWNDPDMIIVGDFGLSMDESRVQMAVWSILAGNWLKHSYDLKLVYLVQYILFPLAPLIMSNDLRQIRQEHIDLLQNRQVIKINQDPLGISGKRVRVENVCFHMQRD